MMATYTPFQWLRITRNGALPPVSARGAASPYFRFLPNSGIVGPNSAYPQQFALPAAAGAEATPASSLLSTAVARQSAANTAATAAPALERGSIAALGRGAIPMGPASLADAVGVAAATNPAASSSGAANLGSAMMRNIGTAAARQSDDGRPVGI